MLDWDLRACFFKNPLSPLLILSMEKTMATKVIGELKSLSRLKVHLPPENELLGE